jgi:hypothetical protein
MLFIESYAHLTGCYTKVDLRSLPQSAATLAISVTVRACFIGPVSSFINDSLRQVLDVAPEPNSVVKTTPVVLRVSIVVVVNDSCRSNLYF